MSVVKCQAHSGFPFPLPLATKREQGHAGVAALPCETVGERSPHSYLSHAHTHTHIHGALCPLSTTTSTSSGSFKTSTAPLGRANGMAGLLVFERHVVWRVEHRGEQGSLIDVGWVVWRQKDRGQLCGHWPILPFSSQWSTASTI